MKLSMRGVIKVVTSVLFTFVFLNLTSAAFAQTRMEVKPGASVRPKITAKCDEITKRIAERIAKWEANEPRKHQAYQNVVTRIQSLISGIDASIDTTVLKTALEKLNQAVLKRHTDVSKVIEDLKASQAYACGESQGQFRTAVNKAKVDFALVKEDTKNIRNIWQNEVRPALRNLKAQKIK